MTCMPLFPDLFFCLFHAITRFRCYKLHALPGTGRSKSRGKPSQVFISSSCIAVSFEAYHFQERDLVCPDGCRRFAGYGEGCRVSFEIVDGFAEFCIRCKVKAHSSCRPESGFPVFTSARAIKTFVSVRRRGSFPFCSSIKSS